MLSITLQNNALEALNLSALDLAIAAWLDAKSKRSGSNKTATAYRDTMTDFRAALRNTGLDLDADPRAVALTAQAWAGSSKVAGREVTAGTFNQRLAILSSFYSHARRQGLIDSENSIARIDRRSSQAYQSATALDVGDVGKRLKAIDRTTLEGKRDYALLSVALMTGRRVMELANLRKSDLLIVDGYVTLIFRRTKGGKAASDLLSKAVSTALLDYLLMFEVSYMTGPTSGPVWVSVSHQNAGEPITGKAISNICQKRLGTAKVHALRHTFAHSMEKSGAAASEIQARLGHESLATTGRYLAALKRANNPYSDELAKLMGITE